MCDRSSNCRNGLVYNERTGKYDPCSACAGGSGGDDSGEESRGNGNRYDGPSR